MSKTTLEGKFSVIAFGEGTQNIGGYHPKEIPYVNFTIVEDSGKETTVELPLDISKNPFEEKRLQNSLIGQKVTFELDEVISTGSHCVTKRLYIKSGEYEGVKVEHNEDY